MSDVKLLLLRKQWFKLKAREFIQRYASGLMVLVLFLPGVAIGDNFRILLLAATKPLLIVVLNEGSFVSKFIWFLVLSSLFIVWARAQRGAITGGAFAQFIHSLPISERIKDQNNIKMLLIANHFLWFFIIAGFYFLNQSSQFMVLDNLRYLFLMFLLVSFQYLSVFRPQRQYFLVMIVLSVGFIVPVNAFFQWILLITLFMSLVFFMKYVLAIKDQKFLTKKSSINKVIENNIAHNIYIQMLFKSGLSSTLFRFGIIALLITGLSLLANHFSLLNDNDLRPYAYVLEAILAYYLSGFYVVFADERKQMKLLFDSLPLQKTYWGKR
ncbi:MAG: hypothetical protein L3J24_12235, partial [Xanthomonadales bacterium]|nr:hypothetical protein [Xanthomonadales bacterium]